MPNFKFDKFLGASIKSQSKPLSDQKNRSSDNYDFRELKKGSRLLWNCPQNISFNVMEDRSDSRDPVTYSNLKNNDITHFPNDDAANGLYIANPKFLDVDATYNFEFNIFVTVIE